MREIRRRLGELKKENEELKNLLAFSGKNRQEYEAKVTNLSRRTSTILFASHCLDPTIGNQLQ